MNIFISALLLMSLNLFAEDQRPMSGIIDTPKGHYAFGPYVNYDSTYLWTVGAAIVKESEDKMVDTFHLNFEASTKGYNELDFAYKKMLNALWSGNLEFDYNTFF
jgi:hypothetical protein